MRKEETFFQKLKYRVVVWLGLLVCLGLPSAWLAHKVVSYLNWEIPAVLNIFLVVLLAFLLFLALASLTVSAILGFMNTLKR